MANFSAWIEAVVSFSSILGFLVSVYVLWEVRQIRRQFLLRIRISGLLRALQNQATEISTRLNDFDESRNEIDVVLAQCESTLRSILPKLSGAEKRPTRHLIKLIKSYHRSNLFRKKRELDYNQAWEVYTALQGIIEGIKHLREDIRSGG